MALGNRCIVLIHTAQKKTNVMRRPDNSTAEICLGKDGEVGTLRPSMLFDWLNAPAPKICRQDLESRKPHDSTSRLFSLATTAIARRYGQERCAETLIPLVDVG